jgi:hypothetical protein
MKNLSNILGIALTSSALAAGIIKEPNFNLDTILSPNAPLYVFNDLRGVSYRGESWSIGAFQYKPGVDIGVALNFDVNQPPYLFLRNKPSNLRLFDLGESITKNSTPIQSDNPIINKIHQKLDSFFEYAKNQEESPFLIGLRDLIQEDCKIKALITPNGAHYGFYYHGTLGGQRIKIADTTLTPGLEGEDYLRVITPVQLTQTLYKETFPEVKDKTVYPLLRVNGVLKVLLNPQVTVALTFDYSTDALDIAGSYETLNDYVVGVFQGNPLPNELNGKIKVNREDIFHGSSGNIKYNDTLELILERFNLNKE